MFLNHVLIFSPTLGVDEAAVGAELQPGFAGNTVPLGTEMRTESPPQAAGDSRPSRYPIQRSSTSSGGTGSKEADLSLDIVSAHTGSAPAAPVRPVTRLSSYPTQATAR